MVPGYTEAERLVTTLRGAGFPEEYISVIYPDTTGTHHVVDVELEERVRTQRLIDVVQQRHGAVEGRQGQSRP